MNVRTYGTDERLGFCRDYLLKKNVCSVSEIILLPIPTTRDGVTISGIDKMPSEISGEPNSVTAVVGYGIPQSFRESFANSGLITVDVSLDEAFTEENATLTANGTVGKILTLENAAPTDLSIGIIGYGRIGKRLLRLLLFLGARVSLFTSKESIMNELCALGISAMPYDVLGKKEVCRELLELDIIINTAPDSIMSDEVIEGLNTTKIIELASGDNFPIGRNVIRLSGIPAKMYPRSAGRVLADSVLRMLGEQT